MGHQGFAGLGAAGHHIDHTRGDARLQHQFAEQARGPGSHLGGLYHHGVAGGEGRRHLHAQGNQRPVPGDDDAHHAVGLRQGVGELVRGQGAGDLAGEFVGPAGVVAGPGGGEPGPDKGTLEGGAVLQARQPNQLIGVLFNQVGETVEAVAALPGRR